MAEPLFHARRLALSYAAQAVLLAQAWKRDGRTGSVAPVAANQAPLPAQPTRPEDFRPLENACFQNPYEFYRLLRNDYPVYRLPNGIHCISRHEDIVAVSRDHERYSSNYQGVIAGLRPGRSIVDEGEKLEAIARLGLAPVNVLALSDPPQHTVERKVAHRGLNAHLVKRVEPEIESLCESMIDVFIDRGQLEFMQDFGWQLPMRLVMRLLGYPETDLGRIKRWCMHAIASQSGVATPAQLMRSRAATLAFMRYCWHQHLLCRRRPRDDLCGVFVAAAADQDHALTDQTAVSAVFQLLIAGSDSSATSMGNALKLLIENPELAEQLRARPEQLPAFIEEVFRLESAFQGHFRWARQDSELHGVPLPRGSRLFLMWASGNRDERVFPNADQIELNRSNGKKHLTFGHGIHACIGRELARAEIRIVLRQFLHRTRNLHLVGEAPYQASMFARTLVRLPIAFDRA